METPFSGTGFRPDEASAAAAQRFFEVLKSLAPGSPGAASAGRDWSQFAGPLAAQYEQWLKMSQSAGPWFSAAAGAGAPGAGFAGGPGAFFGPLPLGPAAVHAGEQQRVWDLVARLGQLQAQLAAHWGEIARSAAQRFVARAGAPLAAPTLEQTLKLYELWVACAEEAYAATARGDDFSRLQSELANVSAALLVEQRRHAESLVRAFGLPTRNEVDALYAHIKDLSRRLAELAEAAGVRPTPAAARPRAAKKVRKPRGAAKRGRRT